MRLNKHAAKEDDQEMSIAEYLKRYRLTIVQKFKTKTVSRYDSPLLQARNLRTLNTE